MDDALSLIVKEGNRAGEVVGRIRALIKKAPARKDAVAINDAILEVIALTRTEAANNGVSVRTRLAEGLPPVQGDRVQLQQILLNLIINAIEAMCDVGEEERELLISSRNEPDGVSVEVRDSGPGLAPEDHERVFEAFYTTKPSGLGLGLSICRSIIEAHNGQLWASPNVPRGAIFRFTAPAHSGRSIVSGMPSPNSMVSLLLGRQRRCVDERLDPRLSEKVRYRTPDPHVFHCEPSFGTSCA
ncbi:signal transduction histidine kinase [Nitrobacteraceae bacterium AZCC 2299]